MKKRIFAIIFAVIVFISMIPSASANNRYIFDLSEKCLATSEIDELDIIAQEIKDEYGFCVLFGITETIDTETNYDFAEQCYKEIATSEYGIMLLHNLTDEKYVVYTTEKAEEFFDTEKTEYLGDLYNDNQSYFGGVSDYYTAVEEILADIDGVTGNVDNPTETEFVPVERTLPLVVDNADLLTDNEEADLETKLNTVTEKYKAEVAVLTVSDLEEKTPQEYADDFYDYNGYGYGDNDDGVLVLFKPGEEGERELYITTHGTAIDALTDGDINTILYAMKDYCVSEDYVGAFNAYVEKCDELLSPPTVPLFWIPVCLAVGFVLSLIITGIMTASLKSVRSQSSAKEYVRQGSMMLTGQQDIFLYSNVTKTEINDDNDNSSTHTSSSGRTHGGGGMSF